MRDRFTELLPLVLVGVILLVYQFTHADSPLPFLPLPTPTAAAVVSAVPTRQPVRTQVAVNGVNVVGDGCSPARPRFVGNIAMLRAAIGSAMGDPLECERKVDGKGNTEQRTTTGLAYSRKQFNASVFTTGWDHWAKRDDGTLVYWASDAVDPPLDAVDVTSQ